MGRVEWLMIQPRLGGGGWRESEKPTLLKTERKEGQPGEDGKQQRKQ